MSREQTNRLLAMLEEDVVSHEAVVTMCLNAMSEDDVALMMDNHELTKRFEEDDGQPDEAQEWHDFDPDC